MKLLGVISITCILFDLLDACDPNCVQCSNNTTCSGCRLGYQLDQQSVCQVQGAGLQPPSNQTNQTQPNGTNISNSTQSQNQSQPPQQNQNQSQANGTQGNSTQQQNQSQPPPQQQQQAPQQQGTQTQTGGQQPGQQQQQPHGNKSANNTQQTGGQQQGGQQQGGQQQGGQQQGGQQQGGKQSQGQQSTGKQQQGGQQQGQANNPGKSNSQQNPQQGGQGSGQQGQAKQGDGKSSNPGQGQQSQGKQGQPGKQGQQQQGLQCPEGQYAAKKSNKCESCDSSCRTCGPSAKQCTDCVASTLRKLDPRQQRCICVPPNQDIPGKSNCGFSCDRSCKTCNASTPDSCTSCDKNSNRILQNGFCVCDSGYYYDSTNLKCTKCHSTCLTCSGQSQFQCLSCQNNTISHRTLYRSQCLCDGLYFEIQKSSQCSTTCPRGFYANNLTRQCVECHQMCNQCVGGAATDCTDCKTDSLTLAEILTTVQSSYQITTPINFQGQVNKYTCSKDVVTVSQPDQGTFKLKWTFTDTSNGFVVLNQSNDYDGISSFYIPAVSALAGYNYTVTFAATESDSSNVFKSSVTVNYQSITNKVVIVGGDRSIGQGQVFQMQAQLFNPQVSQGPIEITYLSNLQWNCTDLSSGEACKDRVGNQINTTENITLVYNGKIFTPYSVNQFSCQIYDNISKTTLTDSAVIIIIEENLPTIQLQVDSSILSSQVNLNQDIYVKLFADNQNPDLLSYSANFFYNYEIAKTIKYYYTSFTLQIRQYFTDFDLEIGNDIAFQAYVFNPQYSLPAKATLNFKVNIPPQACKFQVSPAEGIEFQDKYRLEVFNCTDYDYPLQYRYYYYNSLDDIGNDNSLGYHLKGRALTDYSIDPSFSNYLGANFDLEGRYQSSAYIMMEVMDNLGGMSNFTVQINITKLPVLICARIQQDYSELADISQKITFIQLTSSRVVSILDDMAVTQLKQFLLGEILTLKKSKLSGFQINQLNQATEYLLSGIDILTNLNMYEVEIYQTELETQAEVSYAIQKNLTETVRKFGQSSITQQLSDINILHLQKIGTILSYLVERAQNLTLIATSTNDTQTRVLIKNATRINDQALKVIKTISDTQFSNIIPNQSPLPLKAKTLNSSNQFLTQAGLDNAGANFLGKNFMRMDQEEQIKTPEQTTKFYSFRSNSYKSNPKQTSTKFPYKNQTTQLQGLQIKEHTGSDYDAESDSNTPEVQLQQKIKLSFQIPKGSKNKSSLTCLSQIEDESWDNSQCLTTPDLNAVTCQCGELSLFSVVDDVVGMFTVAQMVDPFTGNAFEKAINFEWWRVAITYMMCAIILLFFLMLGYGYFLDEDDLQSQQSQVHPEEKDQEDEQQKQNQSLANQLKRGDKEFVFEYKVANKYDLEDDPHNKSSLYNSSPGKSFRKISDEQNLKAQGASADDLSEDKPSTFEEGQQDEQVKNSEKKGEATNQKQGFWDFALNEHQLSNPIFEFNSDMSRPLRSCIVFSAIFQSLAITVYFGQNTSLIRSIVIALVTSIACFVSSTVYKKLIGSPRPLLNIIGFIMFVGYNLLVLYIIMVMISSSSSEDQINEWTYQYIISLATDNLFFQFFEIALKYKLKSDALDGNTGFIFSCLKIFC